MHACDGWQCNSWFAWFCLLAYVLIAYISQPLFASACFGVDSDFSIISIITFVTAGLQLPGTGFIQLE